MREWFEQWGIIASVVIGVLTIVGSTAAGVWFVASEIADVRSEVHRIEVRLASVEAKLDLLIEGLNIQVSPKTTDLAGKD